MGAQQYKSFMLYLNCGYVQGGLADVWPVKPLERWICSVPQQQFQNPQMPSECGTVKCSKAVPPTPVNVCSFCNEQAYQLKYNFFLIAWIWSIRCRDRTA